MALTADKVTVWRARLEPYLDTLSVYKQALTNNRYEGDIQPNSTVKILTVADVAESAYAGAWADAAWTGMGTTSVDFTISQLRKFILKVGDTDQAGSALQLVDMGSRRAAYAIANTQDQYIAGLNSEIAAGNCYGTDLAPITVGFAAGEVRPVDAIAMLHQELAEAKAPMTDCRCVVPIWFGTMLRQELGTRQTVGGDAAVMTGMAPGQGLAFRDTAGCSQIWVSANVPNTGGDLYKVICGDPEITFAAAVNKIETTRMQNDFATLVKGLYIYGGKIPFGEFLALGTFSKGTYKQDA